MFDSKPNITQSQFTLMVKLDKNPIPGKPSAAASAQWGKNWCLIKVNPDYYTHRCLGHELRHCLEGDWHKGRDEAC
jgi:hypothetical protein